MDAPPHATTEPPRVSGRAIVIPIALVLIVALGIVAAYKLQTHGDPAQSMSFTRTGPADANLTALPFSAVHKEQKDSFLEDHLDTAVELGASNETSALRIHKMRESLRIITGSDGPTWNVAWRGAAITIQVR